MDKLAFGTPSNTSKKVFSSSNPKSFEVDFPNKILEAIIDFSKSSFEWTNSVRYDDIIFCNDLR